MMTMFVTEPFHYFMSKSFIEFHDQVASSYPISEDWFEPVIMRDYSKFMIPNTVEMQKLQNIINVAFNSFDMEA